MQSYNQSPPVGNFAPMRTNSQHQHLYAQPRHLYGPSPPRSHGQQPPQFFGQLPPQFFGQQASQFNGHQPPQFFDQQPSQFFGQQPSQSLGRQPPQFFGQQPSQSLGQQQPQFNGRQPHQSYGQQLHPSYDQREASRTAQNPVQSPFLQSVGTRELSLEQIPAEFQLDSVGIGSIEQSSSPSSLTEQLELGEYDVLRLKYERDVYSNLRVKYSNEFSAIHRKKLDVQAKYKEACQCARSYDSNSMGLVAEIRQNVHALNLELTYVCDEEIALQRKNFLAIDRVNEVEKELRRVNDKIMSIRFEMCKIKYDFDEYAGICPHD